MHHGHQTSEDGTVEAKYPLPPEGQNVTGVLETLTGSHHPSEESEEDGTWASIAGTKHPEETRHCKEGWYIWTSKSRWAAQEKIDLMMCDLERQAEWQKYKEQINQEWADNEKREMQKANMSVSELAPDNVVEQRQETGHMGPSPPGVDQGHEASPTLAPPFPDAS